MRPEVLRGYGLASYRMLLNMTMVLPSIWPSDYESFHPRRTSMKAHFRVPILIGSVPFSPDTIKNVGRALPWVPSSDPASDLIEDSLPPKSPPSPPNIFHNFNGGGPPLPPPSFATQRNSAQPPHPPPLPPRRPPPPFHHPPFRPPMRGGVHRPPHFSSSGPLPPKVSTTIFVERVVASGGDPRAPNQHHIFRREVPRPPRGRGGERNGLQRMRPPPQFPPPPFPGPPPHPGINIRRGGPGLGHPPPPHVRIHFNGPLPSGLPPKFHHQRRHSWSEMEEPIVEEPSDESRAPSQVSGSRRSSQVFKIEEIL